MLFISGEKYVGEFLKGLEHGKGVHYDADGKRSEGTFKEGKRDGLFIDYDVNGQEVGRTTYVQGLKKN